MRTILAGPLGVKNIGSEHEVSAQEGNELIAGGYAEELPQIAGGVSVEILQKAVELDAEIVSDEPQLDEQEQEEKAPVAKKKGRGK